MSVASLVAPALGLTIDSGRRPHRLAPRGATRNANRFAAAAVTQPDDARDEDILEV
jgi:hypothetical protein